MKNSLIVLWLFISSIVFGEEIIKEITFKSSDLLFETHKRYDIVQLEGASYMMEIGAPALPKISIKILIPPGATAQKVEIISYEKETIRGKFNIFPAQPPVKLSPDAKIPDFAEPNPEVYQSSEPYPGKLVSDKLHNGTKCGYRITDFFIHPLQYIPVEKKLIFYTKIKFKVYYEDGGFAEKRITKRQKEIFGKNVKSMVVNPEDMGKWAPSVHKSKGPYGDWEYVIIAPNNSVWIDSLQVLADWKTKKGVPAMVKIYRIFMTSIPVIVNGT